MKKKIVIVTTFVIICLIVTISAAANTKSQSDNLDFSGDWSKKEMTDIAINNNRKLDTSITEADFANRKDYENYMYNTYGKTEQKPLNPENYSRLLLDENGKVVDFRPSEEYRRDIFITYQLPILEGLTNVQNKANALEKAVKSSY